MRCGHSPGPRGQERPPGTAEPGLFGTEVLLFEPQSGRIAAGGTRRDGLTAPCRPGRRPLGRSHVRPRGESRRPYLGPVPEEAAAVGGSASAHGLLVAQTVEVVVESQLGPCDSGQATRKLPSLPFGRRQRPSQAPAAPAARAQLPPGLCESPRRPPRPSRPHRGTGVAPGTVPAGMSHTANSPTRVSPFTVHLRVSQLGWQLWFMKRE